MNSRPHTPRSLDLAELSDVVSSTECTGLMPTPPDSEEALQARLELSSTALPRDAVLPDPPQRDDAKGARP